MSVAGGLSILDLETVSTQHRRIQSLTMMLPVDDACLVISIKTPKTYLGRHTVCVSYSI